MHKASCIGQPKKDLADLSPSRNRKWKRTKYHVEQWVRIICQYVRLLGLCHPPLTVLCTQYRPHMTVRSIPSHIIVVHVYLQRRSLSEMEPLHKMTSPQ